MSAALVAEEDSCQRRSRLPRTRAVARNEFHQIKYDYRRKIPTHLHSDGIGHHALVHAYAQCHADVLPRVGGRPAIDIEELADGSVNVTLRVAVRKRHIDLSRRYLPIADPNWTFDEQRGTGRMMDESATT